MSRCGVAVAACIAVAMVPAMGLAAEPAPVGTKGVLEVDYIIEGKHSNKVGTDSLDWTVKRQLKAVYHLRAGDLTIAGVSDPAQQQALVANSGVVASQGQAVLTDNADMMAQLEKEADACGDNQACITALAMKMANQPGMQAMGAAMAGANQSATDMMAANPPRFQAWTGDEAEAAASTAEAVYDEALTRVFYDPACTKTKNMCTFNRVRTGKQTYPALGAPAPGILMPTVEIDTKKDLVSIVLYPPMAQTMVQETVTATPEMQSSEVGTRTEQLVFAAGVSQKEAEELRLIGLPLAGGSLSAKGEKVVKLAELNGYAAPLKLTVRWRFRRS